MKLGSMVAVFGLALCISGCAADGKPVAMAADGTPMYGRSFTPNEGDGAVRLNCGVTPNGRLTDCRVVSERPEGKGFGATILATAEGSDARVRGPITPGRRIEFTTYIRED